MTAYIYNASNVTLSTQGIHISQKTIICMEWLIFDAHVKHSPADSIYITGSGPAYLSELLHVYTPSRTLHFFLTLFLTTWSLFEPDPLSPNSPKSLQHFAGAMGWVFDSCQGCRRLTWSPPVIFMTENRPPIICIHRHSPSNYQMFYLNYDCMIYVNGEPECKQ